MLRSVSNPESTMPDNTVEQTIKNLLIETLDPDDYDLEEMAETITGDTHLVQVYGVDSLDFLEFIIRINETFGITIPEETYSSLVSVQRIAAGVQDAIGTQ